MAKRCVGDVGRDAGVDGGAEFGPYRIGGGGRNRGALQGFGDYAALGDGNAEQLGGHAGDHLALVLLRPFAGHRGRGSDAQKLLRLQALPDAAHQQRHVCTLAAAVGVELVQDQEPKAGAVADDPAVQFLLPRHQQLQHHEVGEENVGRMVGNPPPLVPVLLPRVAGERDRGLAGHLADELAQLVHLGVRERVHRVDDDGLRAPVCAGSPRGQHLVDDGDEEAQRLAGPGTRRNDEALALGGERDRLLLVLVERQRLAVGAEYLHAARVQHAARNQGTDVRCPLVAGIDLDQRLRPITILRVDGVHLLADVRRVDRRERRSEALVFTHHAVP